ncbi:hypothetical protein Pelo_5517 [Pelomyxa schiedti]|nr:hypothetical protein Pelo_5517 [Pelomyxa schiedti]
MRLMAASGPPENKSPQDPPPLVPPQTALTTLQPTSHSGITLIAIAQAFGAATNANCTNTNNISNNNKNGGQQDDDRRQSRHHRGHRKGGGAMTVSFVYYGRRSCAQQVPPPTPPLAPSSPASHFKETVWGIGESMDDFVFLILDSKCFPVYINSVGRHLLEMNEILPTVRESTIPGVATFCNSTFIESFMPESERQRTFEEWAKFVTEVPIGTPHIYDTLFSTPRGPLPVHVTDTPLYDSSSGHHFGMHLFKLIDPHDPYRNLQPDPRVQDMAEVLQQSLDH